MQTSNFNNAGIHPDAVNIALRAPENFYNRHYPALNPTYGSFVEYKRTQNQPLFVVRYHNEVLSRLDPRRVLEDLGENAILLCWEAPGHFCHRRLVAAWLEASLGITVPEYVNPYSLM